MTSVEMIDRKEYTPIGGRSPVGGSTRALFHTPPPSAIGEAVKRIQDNFDDAAVDIAALTGMLAQPRLEVEQLGGTKPPKHWRVSYSRERKIKLTMYAKKAWKETAFDAVKADVAELIVQLAALPIYSELTLALLYEFVAGGFLFVQNALYFACGDNHASVVSFLSKHIKARSPNIVLILQQLCENHHSQWQALMHSNSEGDESCIKLVVNYLAEIHGADGAPIKAQDIDMMSNILMFLSESCQGPCLENQNELINSRVVIICADIILAHRKHSEDFDASVTQEMLITLQHLAADVILALLEGRTDDIMQNHLIQVFTINKVIHRLTANFTTIQEKLGSKRHHFFSPLKLLEFATSTPIDIPERSTVEFKGSVNILRIIKSILNLPTDVTPGEKWTAFSDKWRDLQGNTQVKSAVSYFESQMVSVEIARFGSTFTVYFLKPKVSVLLNKGLKERLIDNMSVTADQALEVLVSDTAKDVVDELAVMKYLSQNAFYSTMNEWAPWIRRNMLRLCCYLNFVMLLSVQVSNVPTANLPIGEIPKDQAQYVPYFISVLGFLLIVMSSALWIHVFFSALCFNYSKQQVSSVTKLTFESSANIRQQLKDAFSAPFFYLETFIAMFGVIYYLKLDSGVVHSCVYIAALWLVYCVLAAIRVATGISRFTLNEDNESVSSTCKSIITFSYNVLFDTIFTDTVLIIGFYALCFLLGVGLSLPWLSSFVATGPWGLMFYGFPLLDILATNEKLRFIAQAMGSNFGKLGVTAIFGGIVIYIFSLVGFFFLQDEMTAGNGTNCGTLLQCYASYIRYGLLDGGGIGDYMSSTLSHTLDYSDPKRYFERMAYDMAFYIIIITLFLNMIQGIIIDAFTSVREASEQKAAMRRDRCLVCNRNRNVIELAGMEKGSLNNFSRHTEVEHNLFNYFFYIQYVNGKDDKERNGIESFVYEKLKTKDMSWIPRV
ncbi:type I inositol triphosphate receptor [Thraustotheca clavata]|uniref:Type I inositol triphosphate receptor n=1 Tax=Thraustotheca clavata TaxID=74557 RepID=A0A1W0A656_9STRA|nr:type I inositol triphosphate receptor [Thraustotheca clavata]